MRILLLVLMLAVTVTSAVAQPAIQSSDGELSHGEIYSITGLNFGVKNPAPPLIWESFENGIAETKLDSLNYIDGVMDGGWSMDSDNDRGWDTPRYCDWSSQLRTPGNMARFVYPVHQTSNGLRDIVYTDDLPGGYNGKIFVMLWNKHNYAKLAPQWKRWMVADGPTDTETYPTIGPHFDQTGNRIRSFTASGAVPRGYGDDCADQDHYYHAFEDTTSWHCDELVARYNSSADACDAYCNFWGDFEKIVDDEEGSNWLLSELGHTDRGFKQFRFGRYVKQAVREVTVFYDDVYIDNSWARIYLGNAPVFENCTHREIQIPVTWDLNIATFNVNTGAFTNNEDVYAFLIDEDGVPSAGYPVTIGQSVVGDPPPGYLIINNNDAETSNTEVMLTISVPGAAEMRFSNNDEPDFREGWVTYSTSYSWVLSNSTEPQSTVTGEFRNGSGEIIETVSDSVILMPGAPGKPMRF